MNVERLKIMATILEEVAAGTWKPTQLSSFPKVRQESGAHHVSFDMRRWGSPTERSHHATCGFAACAIGHACLDDRLPELISDSSMMIMPQLAGDDPKDYRPWRSITDYFGIPQETAEAMFSANQYGEEQPSPENVRKRILTLLEQ